MHDILAIGNAICDIIIKVDNNFIKEQNLKKGSMTLIDKARATNLLQICQSQNLEQTLSSGGSAANTTNYLSEFNLDCGFIGNVNSGFYGTKFTSDLKKQKIKFYNCKAQTKDSSAKCIIFVTPDGERTMCTYLGCAGLIELDNINKESYLNSELIYIEGYLWDQQATIENLQRLIMKAKTAKCQIAFSLSDSFCVQRHHESFKALIENQIDILFGNEEEIKAIFDVTSLNANSLKQIQSLIKQMKCKIIAITLNKKGCIILTKEDILEVGTKKVKAIDSTGAGDAFAAGFLYGHLKGNSLTESANIANKLAAEVVGHIGARPKVSLKEYQITTKKIA
jgi:sugar/nucleoside kinase (ribokinase family)